MLNWIFLLSKKTIPFAVIEANVATGNTIRFRECSFTYGDPRGSRYSRIAKFAKSRAAATAIAD